MSLRCALAVAVAKGITFHFHHDNVMPIIRCILVVYGYGVWLFASFSQERSVYKSKAN